MERLKRVKMVKLVEPPKPLVCSVKNCPLPPVIELQIVNEKLKNLCFKHWEAQVRRWLKEIAPLPKIEIPIDAGIDTI